jgi:acyl carrier protein
MSETTKMDRALERAFEEVFKLTAAQVTDDLSPDTLDEWDSLSHLRLVTALEESTGLKFENVEIMDMVSVSAIREILHKKLP